METNINDIQLPQMPKKEEEDSKKDTVKLYRI